MKAHDKDDEIASLFKNPHFKPDQSRAMARKANHLPAPPTMTLADFECYIQAVLKQVPRDYADF